LVQIRRPNPNPRVTILAKLVGFNPTGSIEDRMALKMIVPVIYSESNVDRHIMIETEDAFALARQIARVEGIFVGMSSGAALYAARKVAEEIEAGVIVTIFPDRGERYLSTDQFRGQLGLP
jgi:cysteine synthase B